MNADSSVPSALASLHTLLDKFHSAAPAADADQRGGERPHAGLRALGGAGLELMRQWRVVRVTG